MLNINTVFRTPVIALLAWLLTGTTFFNDAYSAETVTVLTPYKHVVRRGQVSSQALSAVAQRDQYGYSDDWLSYLEFYPGDAGYISVFSFDMTGDLTNRTIDSIEMISNFRGPERREQRWRWHLRNFSTSRWSYLGDNANVPNWRWSVLRHMASGTLKDYVDSTGKMHVLYSSPQSYDNSNVDYIALKLVTSDDEIDNPGNNGPVWQPSPGTSWQWQIKGTIDTSFDVDMYDIDLFDTPQSTIDALHAQGRIVICYFSAGSWENWRPDANAFPEAVKGRSNGWPGEKWLDIRAIDALAPIMSARMDLAVRKGCDGVEPDNIDGYTNNTNFPLTDQHQLNYNIWLAREAHARGLSIGLKNDLDQVEELEPWFDWALNEQCYEYNECDLLTPFINAGKAVFGVEYTGDTSTFCPELNALNFDWLKKDLDLEAPRQACR